MSKKPALNLLQHYVFAHQEELKQKGVLALARKSANTVAENQNFLDHLEDLFAQHPIPGLSKIAAPKKQVRPQRILNLMLSDLHYGSDLRKSESGNVYGPTEEARRTAHIVKCAAEWKLQYRDETTLYLHLAGDIIEGKLHDPQFAAPQTEQFYRSVWNLSQAIQYLAHFFPQISIRCTPGNHGRRKERHNQRAVSQKWDSHENDIYGALKIALMPLKNVTVEIPLTPFYIYKCFDKQGFITHGDSVLNAGYPNRSINVESIRRQINEINTQNHCDFFAVGHVHTASTVRLPSGPSFMTNGCLVPSGDYGVSIGALHNTCSQQIWESVPGIILGHRMEIIVDGKVDKDASLDAIIKPFPGPETFGKP